MHRNVPRLKLELPRRLIIGVRGVEERINDAIAQRRPYMSITRDARRQADDQSRLLSENDVNLGIPNTVRSRACIGWLTASDTTGSR